MSRTHGAQNQNYELKRIALLEQIELRLILEQTISFREMAVVAQVSVPTLRHYFKNRDGVIIAYLAWKRGLGETHLQQAAAATGTFATSVHALLQYSLYGFQHQRVIDIHVVGLSQGLTNPLLGPAYLQSILEPSLAAVETRLATHISRGEMRNVDVRVAALALIAPLILAALHQMELGGEKLRCLDLPQFAKNHGEAFIRGYQSETKG